ncbi:type VII toxin-antitoxin system MntA family adenylyltransferase antitoxin [Paenibacillus sp. 1P07SE]|uniref:type VII toxin-antitoxin system MntA family adenylyltransferase antitoxin n=1 Tax=Paenibacillus sp. 1P07SE TaxID=3132209 RepID=UPI0039A4B920
MESNGDQFSIPPLPGLTALQCRAVLKTLVEALAPASIIVFGSLAKGTHREDSDLDLAYIPNEQKPDAYERFRIAAKIADVVRREVDLIDFEEVSPILQIQVIESGLLLYDGFPKVRQERYMRALKEYAMLNEERSEIIRNRLGRKET